MPKSAVDVVVEPSNAAYTYNPILEMRMEVRDLTDADPLRLYSSGS